MKKILIIDDDEMFAKSLMESLPKEKYTAITALNGEEGLKKVEKENPDLIILDMIMPTMGGQEFLEAVKEKAGGKIIPILIASQLSQLEDIAKGIDSGAGAGVRGYIIKASESLDQIVANIDRIFEEAKG